MNLMSASCCTKGHYRLRPKSQVPFFLKIWLDESIEVELGILQVLRSNFLQGLNGSTIQNFWYQGKWNLEQELV